MSASLLQEARRLVIKVGSSLVTNEGRGLDEHAIGEWCRQMALLVRGEGQGPAREVIMVSSGAVAEGMKRLGWSSRPSEIHELQAAAAVGQMGLAQMYETQLRLHVWAVRRCCSHTPTLPTANGISTLVRPC